MVSGSPSVWSEQAEAGENHQLLLEEGAEQGLQQQREGWGGQEIKCGALQPADHDEYQRTRLSVQPENGADNDEDMASERRPPAGSGERTPFASATPAGSPPAPRMREHVARSNASSQTPIHEESKISTPLPSSRQLLQQQQRVPLNPHQDARCCNEPRGRSHTPVSKSATRGTSPFPTSTAHSAATANDNEQDELREVKRKLRYLETKKNVLELNTRARYLRETVEIWSNELLKAERSLIAKRNELRTLDEQAESPLPNQYGEQYVPPESPAIQLNLSKFNPAEGIDILYFFEDFENQCLRQEVSWKWWPALLESKLPSPLKDAVKRDWRTDVVIGPSNWAAIKASVASLANERRGDLATVCLEKLENLKWDPMVGLHGHLSNALRYYCLWAKAAGYPKKVREGEELKKGILLKAVLKQLPAMLVEEVVLMGDITYDEAKREMEKAYAFHFPKYTPGIASPDLARPAPVVAPVREDGSDNRSAATKVRDEPPPSTTVPSPNSTPQFEQPRRKEKNFQESRLQDEQKFAEPSEEQQDHEEYRYAPKVKMCFNDPCFRPKCLFDHRAGQRRVGSPESRANGHSRGPASDSRFSNKFFTVECRNNPCNRPNCTFKHTRGQKPYQRWQEDAVVGMMGAKDARKRRRDPDAQHDYYRRDDNSRSYNNSHDAVRHSGNGSRGGHEWHSWEDDRRHWLRGDAAGGSHKRYSHQYRRESSTDFSRGFSGASDGDSEYFFERCDDPSCAEPQQWHGTTDHAKKRRR